MAISLSREIFWRPCFSMTSSTLWLHKERMKGNQYCCTCPLADMQSHTFTHTSLLCSGNNLGLRSWSCPTAHRESAWSTRCPWRSRRRPGSPGYVGVGSCGGRAAHLSRCQGNKTGSWAGSSGSGWRRQRTRQAPHPGTRPKYKKKSCRIVIF